MPIRQRRGLWQVDVTFNGTRYRESCQTYEEAVRREVEMRSSLFLEGTVAKATAPQPAPDSAPAQEKITITELFERTANRYWKGKHRDCCKRHSAFFTEVLGASFTIDQFAAAHVDKLVYAMEKQGSSDATINRKMSTLSKMLRFAEERGLITKKPIIEFRKERNGRIRYISPEEEEKMLTTLRSWGQDDIADYLTILVDTGMRVGELNKLQPSDVDGDWIRIWVNKANLPRSVPMTERVKGIITTRGIPQVPYFRLRNFWDRLKSHMELTEDEQFVPHCLRHTCASRLVQRGVGLLIVKEWLGHKGLAMTMRYSHLSPKSLLDAKSVLETTPVTR